MASTGAVKEERFLPLPYPVKVEQPDVRAARCDAPVVEISSSSSSGEDHVGHGDLQNGSAAEVTSPLVSKRPNSVDSQMANGSGPTAKRPRIETNGHHRDMQTMPACRGENPDAGLPADFLQPLGEIHSIAATPQAAVVPSRPISHSSTQPALNKVFRQFWKAGDYDSEKPMNKVRSGGMDHVRVHPKFLHSNATSHKWALGAVAELLDNALDEVVHGATYVKVDMISNPKNGESMLLIEDDGGGMNPDNMRQCMSLGYSAKSKIANTIGQYGNGFKTSTMRLGADVIVFSRCQGSKGAGPTESVGMLSYTFLRETGQEDIIVPMIDYEIQPFGLRKLIRSNVEDWNRNMESIKRWSPYASETEFLDHFKEMKKQGTKIIVFNLWEDDQGQLELDFVTDRHDVQVRGANRDEKQISMADRFPNSRHYLTFQHSLRSYASILYLRLPRGFRMFLRGKEVGHHNLIDDLMFTEVLNYRPVGSDVQIDTGQMKAVVTLGFVKDAKEHIDVQGFNVYHKNRLIKPFWRIWNSAASRGRGIIGVLEANFVEPAHDKQGFERTIVLARLEARLLEMQKNYWTKHCHKVGYVNNSLKGKDGKTAELKDASASGDTMHLAAVVSRSMPLPVTPSPPRPRMQVGNLPGMHVPPAVGVPAGHPSALSNLAVPVGLARSKQLQTQVRVTRAENCVHDVQLQALRQVRPQALPMSTSMPLQKPREFGAPAVSQSEARAPVTSSALQNKNTQSQERLRGQLYNASQSPLPPLPSSFLQIRPVQPELARQVMPSSGPSLASPLRPESARRVMPSSGPSLVSPMQPHVSQAIPAISQVLCPNHVSPSGRIMGNTLNVVQDASVKSSTVTENVSIQSPGSGLEAVKAAVTHPQSVESSVCKVQGLTGNTHKLQNVTSSPKVGLLSSNISTKLGREIGQICEKEIEPMGVVDTAMNMLRTDESVKSPSAVCIEQVEVQVDGHTEGMERNGQGSTNAGTFNASVGAEAFPVISGGSEPESSGFRPAEVTLRNWREVNTCAATVNPSCNLPCTILLSNPGQAAHTQSEQILLKPPRSSNKDTGLGRKSLEDLGRMFARKAATITQGEQVNKLKDPDAKAIVPIVTEYHPSSSRELEAHLMEMELEVERLHHMLDTLMVERDHLRQQLIEERAQGELKKQELQKKVEQTWAKVRELEAQNERLRLTKD